MALRVYTREEFEAELKNTLGLHLVAEQTSTIEEWRTPKGHPILVRRLPDDELYPHFMVGKIAAKVRLLDAN